MSFQCSRCQTRGLPIGSLNGPYGESATSTPIPLPWSGQYMYHFPPRSMTCIAHAPFSLLRAHSKSLSDATAPQSRQFTMSVEV